MAGINKVILVGNVGNDPEIRSFPDGTSIMNLSLATSESWKDQAGVKQERTEWHRVVLTGKLADALSPFIRKGIKLYCEGKLMTRKWQDQSGQDRYITEIRVRDVQLLDRREDSPKPAPAQQPYQPAPAQQPYQPAPAQQPAQFSRPAPNAYEQARQQPAHPQPRGGLDDFDDSIPF